ncbi:MAG: tRNA (adenosine(37)-N6)-dimethylallyltransferase MiaA, partial [Sphingomonadales bacterium]|nr:tRNA (adenosine(37)-N6)-dimethylallyltransferase MiaA [Sphingomonadales bacterium]
FRRCDDRFDRCWLRVGWRRHGTEAMHLDPALPAMRAVGVPPLLQMLSGELGEAEAIARAKQHTRHYVRRQLTWLNRHMGAWNRDVSSYNCV